MSTPMLQNLLVHMGLIYLMQGDRLYAWKQTRMSVPTSLPINNRRVLWLTCVAVSHKMVRRNPSMPSKILLPQAEYELLLDLLSEPLRELVLERSTLEDDDYVLSLSPWEAFKINSASYQQFFDKKQN